MTELEVCNWALLKLGQRPIVGLSEDSFKADCCRLLLYPIYRSLLRSFAWSFATKFACVPPISTAGEEVCYPLPQDCLKVFKVVGDGELRGHQFISRTQSRDPLRIEYIANVPFSHGDPLFQEAVACKLASELCPVLAADSQLTLSFKAEFEAVKKIAIDMDGMGSVALDEY